MSENENLFRVNKMSMSYLITLKVLFKACFNYKQGYFSKEDNNPYAYDIQVGFIAEEVNKCYAPATVYDGELIESWEERKLIPPMLQLIQEQYEEIKQLKQEVQMLKEKNYVCSN